MFVCQISTGNRLAFPSRMISAPIPIDESARLKDLAALNVLFTPGEERFDRITRMASRLLDMPISVVSLVGSDFQWFKSTRGLGMEGSPRSGSFCAHAILSDRPLVVPDTLLDSRFRDSPLVVGEPFLRSYAGQPLHGNSGKCVGSLCVMDRRPRQFTEADLESLRDLGVWAESELKSHALSASQRELINEVESLRRLALIDRLTHSWNRGAIDDIFGRELERARREASSLTLALVDIDHFKRINDGHGHPAGDEVLREVARRIRGALRPFDALGRYGGEEFLLVLSNCEPVDGLLVAERVAEAVRALPVRLPSGESIQVTVSVGIHAAVPYEGNGEQAIWIEETDQALYRSKAAGRDRVSTSKSLSRAA
jgi:diguanylate cyclase (GGDEF)-like protein